MGFGFGLRFWNGWGWPYNNNIATSKFSNKRDVVY